MIFTPQTYLAPTYLLHNKDIKISYQLINQNLLKWKTKKPFAYLSFEITFKYFPCIYFPNGDPEKLEFSTWFLLVNKFLFLFVLK